MQNESIGMYLIYVNEYSWEKNNKSIIYIRLLDDFFSLEIFKEIEKCFMRANINKIVKSHELKYC